MSASADISNVPVANNGKMLRAMVGIGVICALLIVLTFEGTLPRIERLKAEALERAIFTVVPGTTEKATFRLTADGAFEQVEAQDKDGRYVFAGYGADGSLKGIAVEARGMGFADILTIIYGYDPASETIIGFYVLGKQRNTRPWRQDRKGSRVS